MAASSAMDATPDPKAAEPERKPVFISTLRYYPVGAIECAICRRPGEVVRLASSPAGDILVTVMCDGCGQREADSMVKDGEMVRQGSMLVNVHYIAQVNEAARAHSENANGPPEKVPSELEGGADE